MNLLSERLKWAMDKKTERDGTEVIAADLARAAKVSETSCSYWLAGSNGMSAAKARLVAAFLGVDPIWLETGKGSPELRTEETNTVVESVAIPLNEHIAAVVKLMESTDERGMRKVRDAAEDALDKYRISQKSMSDISSLHISPELLESKEFIKAINLLVKTFSKEELIQKAN